jgi:hypothetical protein
VTLSTNREAHVIGISGRQPLLRCFRSFDSSTRRFHFAGNARNVIR